MIPPHNPSLGPLLIESQGSFAVGGSVRRDPGTFDPTEPDLGLGQTYSGDHAYAFYQKPVNARRMPLVMWHGGVQFSKSWETTPDGREGFQTLFLRRGFTTVVLDQPRRGNAGRSMVEGADRPIADEQKWFNQFRLGLWPDYYDGVQFDRSAETLDQYFRSMTPNTGPFDLEVVSSAVSALFDRVGPAILMTHSQSGGPGWLTAMRNDKVRSIVSFEPGSNFVFPEGQAPSPMPSAAGPLAALTVPTQSFLALTQIPIIIYYGDNIPEEPTPIQGRDSWRVRLAMAHRFVETVNRHGGDAQVVELPKIGIAGNTHFPFSDLNNLEIADLVSHFLTSKGLD
ncbi:alpha/beta hydrolase [Rhizobium sp. CF142]|uniref:alpha/beta hydrolase n=1 Tax=Rhizobium sp. CF142 TaxID=1144314 RepID=UPI00026F0507|nr:alpha/beta fold hydrolase [Rhizobium sp. CF142]EJJ25576.1 hypothetical protein PMI11_06194 [Rhizobium sp. CF142]